MPSDQDILSHEEVWDDSALIDSWNEALAEYKQQIDSAEQEPVAPAASVAPPPQALLGSIRDDGLKKLLMSWYYAGYYTGLYEGQQQQDQRRS
ncbi:hypothetical protein E4U54_000386 [Claviceps lovelessii]|nr:hypothetical protein E4U54_000386 [Claviceps lovelessii]